MGWARKSFGCTSTLLLLLLLGCSPASPHAIETPGGNSPTETFTPIPTFTQTASATPAKLVTVTAAANATASTFFAEVSADNVNLRTRPGTVFPVSRLLAKGTRLQVLGHAPGGEWLYVRTDENIEGWVLTWLVKPGRDGGISPVVQPQGVQVVQGSVVDRSGVPISGIGFAVTQGSGAAAARTDATTDAAGQFYAYLPASAAGTWSVSYVSVACASNTMDAQCNCIGTCGRADPQSVSITLPLGHILQFVWK